ncbi:pyrimidine dimer DNA glycosylase/endonuclease V [Methanobacterium aggregans]|uniref:pyrimidine dimer DNA glycosylase/endonuclease V n=1 Tax=Methanobacterium aggregans TaxID=1615586 RepID=UPI001AE3C88D|nr:pyrimidine dimer DNA glycosylase/endonuclease V [Methanobacterium aggregans]MBP2045083.1 hypothetical protein [Methanobacterium aggregans]
MRLWSLHPKYLDSKGIVALWREGLLARAVLMGKTMGYRNHPQLQRFKIQDEPLVAIDTYLYHVYLESQKRGYSFKRDKIGNKFMENQIHVTLGQMEYEFNHLKEKLKLRNVSMHRKLQELDELVPNPVFKVVEGGVEDWEVIK